MPESPSFLMMTCQVGAESAVKLELSHRWPEFRFAYSRPGFLTFRLPPVHRLSDDFRLRAVFVRAHCFSLGRAEGATVAQLARDAWRRYGDRPAQRVHVWTRDARPVGEHGFELSITPEAIEVREAIRSACPRAGELAIEDASYDVPARRGEAVLDCIVVAPGEWWIGYHRVRSVVSRWPGGIMPLHLPEDAVSRAWLKMEEALRWSRLPIPPATRVAEIGSAPGGASQALLGRGFHVVGIDPAEMAPSVLDHPRFRHIRSRSRQVRRREFRKIHWLTADMNVAPKYTLDVVEEIVTRPDVHIRGMLLTLKLPDWGAAEEIPGHLERIRKWGYNVVRARQLVHNRREVCVAALRKTFVGRRTQARRRHGGAT